MQRRNFSISHNLVACTVLLGFFFEMTDSPPVGAVVERIDGKLFWEHTLYYYAKVEGYDELKYVLMIIFKPYD